jgi:hypothetical protein
MEFLKKSNKLEELYNEIPVVKRRKKGRLIMKTLKYFSLSLVVTGIILFAYLLYNFFIFQSVYQDLLNGKKRIEYSAQLIKDKNFTEASEYAEEARRNFHKASGNLEKINSNFLIRNIFFVKSQIDGLIYLTSTAEVLSRTAISFSTVGADIKNTIGEERVAFSDLSTHKKRSILSILHKSTPELNGMRANIDLAINNIDNIKYGILLFPIKNKIENLNIYLKEALSFLDDAVPLSQIMPSLLGFPEKSSFLVLMQNKDELRPTGGFIGTYGILETRDGDISRFDTHDIYHMDMPVKDLIDVKPPEPLQKYLGVDKWYMRDSNWSPDWPTAVEQIKWFYKEEDRLLPEKDQINNFSGDFDGVIGLNTDLVAELLGIIGPVVIEDNVYTEDNFSELLEYRVEKSYVQLGVPSWHRKEVIGDIVKEIKKRVLSRSILEMYDIYGMLSDNLLEKNIVVNFQDPEFQDIIKEKNWSGHIRDVKSDFLMVVDANMAAFKTDAVISRNIEYELTETINGVFADLKIHYSHNGNFDWRTTRYRTYTRIYVPEGAELIETQKYDNKIDVSLEHGKTVFGTFISIEPQKVGTLHFYYKLPQGVEDDIENNEYELVIQKQSGNDTESLEVDLEFLNNVTAYSPTGFYSVKGVRDIKWSTDLRVDKKFSVELVD